MNLVVYTCIFGNYEGLLPQIKTPGVALFVSQMERSGQNAGRLWK